MQRVELIYSSISTGKYLYKGYGIESCIVNFIEENKGDEHFEHNLLLDKINKANKSGVCAEDYVCGILRQVVSLDFEFAKQLNIYDVFSSNCLTGMFSKELSRSLVSIIEQLELYFMVTMKVYNSADDISLDVEVCHYDYIRDLRRVAETKGVY